jgi:hypothetical protein
MSHAGVDLVERPRAQIAQALSVVGVLVRRRRPRGRQRNPPSVGCQGSLDLGKRLADLLPFLGVETPHQQRHPAKVADGLGEIGSLSPLAGLRFDHRPDLGACLLAGRLHDPEFAGCAAGSHALAHLSGLLSGRRLAVRVDGRPPHLRCTDVADELVLRRFVIARDSALAFIQWHTHLLRTYMAKNGQHFGPPISSAKLAPSTSSALGHPGRA